ncbi:MAG: SDR family NAD(P)-dependent oxidoreductase [Bacteroidota bacterium]
MEKDFVIITGGAGFIGSHMAKWYCENDYGVVVIDNLFRGSLDNIRSLIENHDLVFENHDLADYNSIQAISEIIEKYKPIQVLHYAAINGTQYFYDKPQQVVEVNSIATLYLLKALRKAKNNINNIHPLILFASTSENYCEPFNVPTKETDLTYFRIEQNRDSYAVAKMASEFYVKLYCEELELDWVVLRIFNVYGPKMVGTKYGQVIPEFVQRVKNGEYPLKIFGNGKHTRSFIHIDDHVELTTRLIFSKNLTKNTVYNLGNDYEISILEVGKIVMALLGKAPKFEFLEEREGDHLRRSPDLTKLFSIIGEFEFIGLKEGISTMI